MRVKAKVYFLKSAVKAKDMTAIKNELLCGRVIGQKVGLKRGITVK